MNFENYTSRITSLTNFDSLEKPPADYKERCREKHALKQTFSQFNDKRSYFSDGTTSLPLSHPYLEELVEFKTKWDGKLKNIFGMKKKKSVTDREQSAKAK